jgi:hypothetical protein
MKLSIIFYGLYILIIFALFAGLYFYNDEFEGLFFMLMLCTNVLIGFSVLYQLFMNMKTLFVRLENLPTLKTVLKMLINPLTIFCLLFSVIASLILSFTGQGKNYLLFGSSFLLSLLVGLKLSNIMNSSHIPLLFVYILPIILNLLTLIMINVLIFRIDKNNPYNKIKLSKQKTEKMNMVKLLLLINFILIVSTILIECSIDHNSNSNIDSILTTVMFLVHISSFYHYYVLDDMINFIKLDLLADKDLDFKLNKI